MPAKVLVADKIAPAAIEMLKSEPDIEVVVSTPQEFISQLGDADAVLVRSAAKVTPEAFAAAPKLKAVGRAGVGVDNIDLKEATSRGVVVMNTPGGNAVSVAEHTLGFMLAMARHVVPADASMKTGKWEKKKFLGNEIQGKTLGIIGLGNIGLQVARRAKPFNMKLIAFDPFASRQLAADRGVALVELEELLAQSDYVSLHVALTPDTRKLINAKTIAKMKDGARLVNCARGELVDGDAVHAAIESGKLAGAALDVFDPEPPGADCAVLQHANVLGTPHIGGSTEEAQELVGIRIAEQVRDYLRSGVVTNAVNTPSVSAEQFAKLSPYLDLASRLGSFVGQICGGQPQKVNLAYSGGYADENSSMVRNAALAGILNSFLSQPANVINAADVAAERGVSFEEKHSKPTRGSETLGLKVAGDCGGWQVEGILSPDGKARLSSVDGIFIEAQLDGHMVVLRNTDVPGVIGHIGTILGDAGVNIADFSLGRSEKAADGAVEAIAVVRLDQAATPAALKALGELDAVRQALAIELTG